MVRMATNTVTMPLSKIVAAAIRAEAARRGLTQTEFASMLGMSKMAMSDRYRERTPWTLDEMQKVADLFKLEIGDLVARPKGFEPLTFWLGADHTITGFIRVAGDDFISGWCDACGIVAGAVDPASFTRRVVRHVERKHVGSGGVERAA